MSKQPQESAWDTFWRATIMLGAMVVGGMAVYLYGPPPEKAAEIIDQVAGRVQTLIEEQTAESPTTPAPQPPPAWTGGGRLAEAPLTPPLQPPPLQAPPLSPTAGAESSELARLGAEEVSIEAWGADGAWYRAEFSVAMAGGFRRHFDAIEASPSRAIAAATAELREWRTASGWPINR